MRYNIVAGEELKKIMTNIISNPIPFNEDMNKGTFSNEPFSIEFIKERITTHGVSVDLYKEKLKEFFMMLDNLSNNDEIHLYFGEDETCLANRGFLINYFSNKVKNIVLHVVNEYTGEELNTHVIKQ